MGQADVQKFYFIYLTCLVLKSSTKSLKLQKLKSLADVEHENDFEVFRT